jgi:UDP-GlcNAc:undecaprenyl-phosphate GlcNAc-1-phosphate transferase
MIQSLAFLLAILLAHQITPLVRLAMWRFTIIDAPNSTNPGKIHRIPTPLAGGLAIWASTWLVVTLVGQWSVMVAILTGASTAMLLLGFIDDVYILDWKPRILLQAAVAVSFLLLTGIQLPGFNGAWFSVPLMVFWLVGVTNAVNLMDNIDGATSGIVFLAGVLLFLVEPASPAGLVSLVLAGGALGFLRYNSKPASIFLGDTGTLFLGFSLGALALLQAKHVAGGATHLIAFPLILGVPVFDTTLASFLRIKRGRPIYLPDKSNLTFRLQGLGLSDRRIVFLEYSLAGFLGLCALGSLQLAGAAALAPAAVAAAVLLVVGGRLSVIPYPNELPALHIAEPSPAQRSTQTAA